MMGGEAVPDAGVGLPGGEAVPDAGSACRPERTAAGGSRGSSPPGQQSKESGCE
jgi:hypothetical protein